MTKPFVTTDLRILVGLAAAFAVGVLSGAGGGFAAQQFQAKPIDPRLSQMCDWPSTEGGGMFVTLLSGKYVCWDNLR